MSEIRKTIEGYQWNRDKCLMEPMPAFFDALHALSFGCASAPGIGGTADNPPFERNIQHNEEENDDR